MNKVGILMIVVLSFILGVGLQYEAGLIPNKAVESEAEHVHESDSSHDDSHAHGHGHGHGDEKSSQMTIYDDAIEIFLEHPYLVAGKGAEFITHVSYLTSGLPRKSGPATFVMQYGEEEPIEHVENAPARDGIYIPTLTFPKEGIWKLSLAIPMDNYVHTIALIDVTVYASQALADAAPEEDGPEGISFLKEQQWVWRTLAVPAKTDNGNIVIPSSCIVYEKDLASVYVQISGEVVEKRTVETVEENNGYVQIASGIKPGERVISRSAYVIAQQEQAGDTSNGHADHGDEPGMVHLEDDAIHKHEIVSSNVGPDTLSMQIALKGQIALNADRIAHITPVVSGTVKQILSSVGDKVEKGDILAWIESIELGEAKAEYVKKHAEMSCSIELDRAEAVYTSTNELLKILEEMPSIEQLNKLQLKATGENHSKLLTAYSNYLLAVNTYAREKELFNKKISSQEDYNIAERDYQSAVAEYAALRDSEKYEVEHTLIEARQDQRLREIEVQNAEDALHILGMSENEVATLGQAGIPEEDTHGHDSHSHNDSHQHAHDNMPDREHLKLTWYPLTAPFAGTILEKNITLGKSIEKNIEALFMADMDNFWIDFQVYSDDLDYVKPGQKIIVNSGPSQDGMECSVVYVSPVVNKETRTCLVRAVLSNETGNLRPGQFVEGTLLVDEFRADLVVDKDAVQYIDDKPCVFIKTADGFEKRNVMLGRSTSDKVEIIAGISSDDEVVVQNAFLIKSEAEKTPDAYGGHGHPH